MKARPRPPLPKPDVLPTPAVREGPYDKPIAKLQEQVVNLVTINEGLVSLSEEAGAQLATLEEHVKNLQAQVSRLQRKSR